MPARVGRIIGALPPVILSHRILVVLLGGLGILGAVPSPARAQTIETHPAAGVRFPRPSGYEQIPVPPLQTDVVLRFMDRPPSGRSGAVLARKQVLFVSLDASDGTPEERWERLWRWLPDLGLRPSIWGSPEDGVRKWENHHGETVRKFEVLSPVSPREPLWIFHGPDRTLAVVGFGFGPGQLDLQEDEVERDYDGWAFAIEEMRLFPPEVPDIDKLARVHRREGLAQPEYRAAVEASLVRGWKSDNTEHFIIVYNTGNEPFIRAIKDELETLRAAFAAVFPPSSELHRVSTVRICHDLSEYLAYGGPLNSGGFWSPLLRELVLFDNARRDGVSGWTNADTRRVLYHEAFHQYIRDAVGDLDPGMWFNEGLGDYFSGARLKKGELEECVPVPERLAVIQRALAEHGRGLPWDELLFYDREGFYEPSRADLCYAQSWSLVYFLMRAPVVRERPEWSSILPTYFDTLKRANAEELETFQRDGGGVADVHDGSARARARALEAAFGPVDLDELDRAWKAFVSGL